MARLRAPAVECLDLDTSAWTDAKDRLCQTMDLAVTSLAAVYS